jgi:hypothetical protein
MLKRAALNRMSRIDGGRVQVECCPTAHQLQLRFDK